MMSISRRSIRPPFVAYNPPFLNSWFLEKKKEKEKNGIVSFRVFFLRRVIVGETDRKESDTIRQECGTRLEIEGN